MTRETGETRSASSVDGRTLEAWCRRPPQRHAGRACCSSPTRRGWMPGSGRAPTLFGEEGYAVLAVAGLYRTRARSARRRMRCARCPSTRGRNDRAASPCWATVAGGANSPAGRHPPSMRSVAFDPAGLVDGVRQSGCRLPRRLLLSTGPGTSAEAEEAAAKRIERGLDRRDGSAVVRLPREPRPASRSRTGQRLRQARRQPRPRPGARAVAPRARPALRPRRAVRGACPPRVRDPRRRRHHGDDDRRALCQPRARRWPAASATTC